jgi:hypothetical protein
MVALGEAGAGSMGPKLHAAARFAEAGGTAVIASLDDATEAVAGSRGTRIVAPAAVAASAVPAATGPQTRRSLARP